MLHTLAVLPALQLSAATYDTWAILFRGQGRNIYRAGDFYDVISPTGDSVSARGDIWRGANLLRDTGSSEHCFSPILEMMYSKALSIHLPNFVPF